jgi:Tol biopolymer transport system component
MGEVFRAHDARLKRDVALKVLPATALADADRRSRFEREAQVLASLNHPSIAQVYGVELDGGAPVIVMELVEGATLADRLAAGALPLADALPIAIQICDGLEAAHERGVVHRDLKPANIKVRPDGTIKILDFGLARVLTEDAPADQANSPTMLARTASGIILGTAPYMSPEQARGRGVDKRTDIWAFGCVLYEMLSGVRTFAGESIADVVAAVVEREPDWSRLPANTPPRIVELLHRCLKKNPKDRLRDVGDARFEIEHAREPRSAVSSAPAKRSPLIPVAWFAAGAAVAAAIMLWATMGGAPAADTAPIRAVVKLPPNTTLALSRGSAVAISADGRRLAFAGRTNGKVQLYLRSLDRFESQPLAGTDDATNPFFSPDGRWIGFFADGKLKKVTVDGGAPVPIVEISNARGEVWGPNDQIFVVPTNNVAISKLSAVGGKLEPATKLREGQFSHRWPRVLPDGALLYSIWNDLGWEPAQLAAERAGGEQKIVVDGGGYGHYIRDAGRQGFLVYARAEGLLATRFDESQLATMGQALPVVDGVLTNLSGGAHFDVSESGTLAYVPGTFSEVDRELEWVSLDGKISPVAKLNAMSRVWSLSTDGTRVVRSNTVGTSRDIMIEHLQLGTTTRLGSAGGYTAAALWMPNGKTLVFAKDMQPHTNIFQRDIDTGVQTQLTKKDRTQTPTGISPDGKFLLFAEFDPQSGSDIWVLPLTAGGPGGNDARPFVKTTFIEGSAVFSPDGKWVAYQGNDAGRFEIFVRSFPDAQQVFRISTEGGIAPVWSPTGRDLFYRALSGKMMAAAISPGPAFQAAKPRVLFDATAFESVYAVAPDGQRLLMMPLLKDEQAAREVYVIFNFLTELRQRVK